MSVRDQMNPKREITINKYSNLVDAFNRLRVSAPIILFDSQLEYSKVPGIWFDKKSTSAVITHLSSEASVELKTVGADMSAIRQSRSYIRYQPGKSQLVMMTFGDFISATDVTKHVGYFDAENGIFLKSDASGYYFVKRSKTSGAVVDTIIPQSEWTFDKLDGSGPSRYTLDFSKVQICLIDFEWLGVGRVRCGFVLDGSIVYAHEFTQANMGTEVYMKTPNLPLRYEIIAGVGASGDNTLKQICASVMSEGGDSTPTGSLHATSLDTALVALTSSTPREIISIRPRTTYKGKTNRINIVVDSIDVYSQDSDLHYHIVWGGESDSSSAGWLPVSTAFSGVDVTKEGATITGGVTIQEGYIPASQALGTFTGVSGTDTKIFRRNIPIALHIDGTHPTVTNDTLSDQLGIIVTPISADTDVGATIHWVEEA